MDSNSVGKGDSPDPKTASLKVSDSFKSYTELMKKVEEFQNETYTVYKVRDCLTKAQGIKLGRVKTLKDGIEYYSLKFVCMHGGRNNRKSTSTGQREAKTFQLGCEANFLVVANSTGDALIIKKMNLSHNHETTKRLFECSPDNRRLNAEEKEIAKQQLQLGANKKKVKNHIQNVTGKKVLSKDLSNLTIRTQDGNDLRKTVHMLQHEYGADCEVLIKEDTFEGILFVTEHMKKAMEAYPEFIGIDATYKLLNLRAPLYLIVVEDSQGQTEIVAGCILMHETYENVQWFIDQFKEKHPAWDRIITVMADKDFTERDVIKKSLPRAKVLICIFHTQRTFNRELTTEKLGITSGQKDTSKSIIQKMIYSESEKDYLVLYERLKAETPISVQEYFNKNWHDIREEWALCGDFLKMSFCNTTNNRLESLNGKIKTIAARFATLEKFIVDFFILITTRETEHDIVAAYSHLKKKAVPFEETSPEYFYSKHLTNYGFGFVRRELEKKTTYQITGLDADTANLIIQRDNGKSRCVTENSCTCPDHLSMGLPCRHIFAAREYLNLPLTDESLCLQRWTQAYYMQNQGVFEKCAHTSKITQQPLLNISSQKTTKTLTQGQKLKMGQIELLQINSLLSEFSTPKFHEYIQFFHEVKRRLLLKQPILLASFLENNESFTEVEVSNQKNAEPLPVKEASLPAKDATFTEGEVSLLESEALSENEEASCVLFDLQCNVLNMSSVEDNFEEFELEDKNGKTMLTDSNVKLDSIKMPPAIKMRGRPKHSTTTTPMGISKKIKPKKNDGIPFRKKAVEAKIRQTLKWIVTEPVIEKALMGHKIREEEVETMPEKVSAAILDDDVSYL